MERKHASTMTRQFKRSFSEETLNELGKMARFCRREWLVTPFRLALCLIESFSTGSVKSIADIQRAFNALCESAVCYKAFHNQLAKRQFPTFVRLLLSRLLNELACEGLRFSPSSPFARFEHIRIQDLSIVAQCAAILVLFMADGSLNILRPQDWYATYSADTALVSAASKWCKGASERQNVKPWMLEKAGCIVSR